MPIKTISLCVCVYVCIEIKDVKTEFFSTTGTRLVKTGF